jgi:NAD-dependent SIR2 family protein deacetylase
MGVDAGIPDFRGASGIWTEDKTTFMKFALASAFEEHPVDAWNFYINRYINYSKVAPHRGYYDLLKLTKTKDVFVVTSNVDGHFERTGFDPEKIVEIHGNLKTIQCSKYCCRTPLPISPMPDWQAELKDNSEIPQCRECGAILRPQVLMFNDPYFYYNTLDEQLARYRKWEASKKNILGIEIGAGTSIPSIRMFGNERTHTLIRINPYDSQINREQDISIAETAITGIDLVFKMLYNTENNVKIGEVLDFNNQKDCESLKL